MSQRELFKDWFARPLPDVEHPHPLLGELLRDDAIERVRVAHGPWIDRALAWILAMPSGAEFTTDDLWQRSASLPDVLKPRERRAMGAVMKQAARLGLVSSTGGYRKSSRPECHARPVAVWRRL